MIPFDEIYIAEHARAVRFARHRCGLQRDIAEQIVTDAFMDLYKALENEVEIENPIAWLRATIHMRNAEHHRHEHRVKRGGKFTKQPELMEADFYSDLAVEHPGFDAIDAADSLQSIWHHLTEAEQKIATMVFMQEINQTQIATQLGITLRTVERRVNRVRNRLRTLLSPSP